MRLGATCGAPRPTYLPVVAHSAVESPVKSLRGESHLVITLTMASYHPPSLLWLLTMATLLWLLTMAYM